MSNRRWIERTIPPSAESCANRGCAEPGEFFTAWFFGDSAKKRRVCRFHAEQFAAKHGIQIEGVA
jgi:hypothetical protein